MQVLIADDDPVYRGMLQQLLEQWGFEVVLASDGAEAWKVLQRQNAPRLVVLDWMMPGLDGYEVARLVRDGKDNERTYILLVTGSQKKDEVIRVLVCGADDFLMKPFNATELKIRIRTAVRVLDLQDRISELQAAVQPAAAGLASPGR